MFDDQGDGARLHAVSMALGYGQHVGTTTQQVDERVVAVYRVIVHGYDLVALLQTNLSSWRLGQHAVNLGRQQRAYERRVCLHHVQQVQLARQRDAHGLAVADDIYTMGLRDVAVEVGGEVLEGVCFGADEDVAVLESVRLGFLVELHTQRHILHGDVGVAPPEQDLSVDEQGEQEVDQHTANHDEQALPGRLGAELIVLYGLLHLLRVEALVNHTGYLAVATQWQPSDAVFRIAVLGLELEQAELPVEEDVELINPHSEELGEEEVTTLVQQDEQRDGQNEL